MLKLVLFAILKKAIITFLNIIRECKECNMKIVLKRYYNNIYVFLQKRREKYACFRDLDNRLKALEEKLLV